MQIRLYVSLKVTLQFQDLSDLENSSILCLTDAAFANFKNGGSQVLMNVNDITFIYFNKRSTCLAWWVVQLSSRSFDRISIWQQ